MTIQQALHLPHDHPYNEQILDLQNKTSGNTAAIFMGKSGTKEHVPFVVEAGVTKLNFHYIKEVRHLLSEEVTTNAFSHSEQMEYDKFLNYMDNGVETLEALLLEQWLLDEIQGITHPTITREYKKGVHPWRILDGREDIAHE